MGNFSVNHYARLEPGPHGVAIRYVMDLAEIPTFEMLQQWGPGADPQKKAMEQAREWAAKLEVAVNGKRMPVRVVRAQVALAEGAGNMQVARITADLQVDATAGSVDLRRSQLRGAKRLEGDRRPGRQGSQRGFDGVSAGPDGGAAAGVEDRILVDRTASRRRPGRG